MTIGEYHEDDVSVSFSFAGGVFPAGQRCTSPRFFSDRGVNVTVESNKTLIFPTIHGEWIPWWIGCVTETPRRGKVFSGSFSACPFVIYRKRGIEYVGHVGLQGAAISKGVLDFFYSSCADCDIELLSHFQPDIGNNYVKMENHQRATDSLAVVFAVIDTDGMCYALDMWKISKDRFNYRLGVIRHVENEIRDTSFYRPDTRRRRNTM